MTTLIIFGWCNNPSNPSNPSNHDNPDISSLKVVFFSHDIHSVMIQP